MRDKRTRQSRPNPGRRVAQTFGTSLAFAFVVVVLSCASKSDPAGASASAKSNADATKTCEAAADRWAKCMGEVLGPEAEKMANAKRDIPACVKDRKTVQMYEKCLKEDSCTTLMQCMENEARTNGP